MRVVGGADVLQRRTQRHRAHRAVGFAGLLPQRHLRNLNAGPTAEHDQRPDAAVRGGGLEAEEELRRVDRSARPRGQLVGDRLG